MMIGKRLLRLEEWAERISGEDAEKAGVLGGLLLAGRPVEDIQFFIKMKLAAYGGDVLTPGQWERLKRLLAPVDASGAMLTWFHNPPRRESSIPPGATLNQAAGALRDKIQAARAAARR